VTEAYSNLLNRPEIAFPRELLARVVAGRRVLITGAAGSIGTSLARQVQRFEPECLALLDSHEASLFRLGQALERPAIDRSVRYILADLRDRQKLAQIIEAMAPELIFHLGAYKQVPLSEANVDQVVAVNVLATVDLVALAAKQTGAVVVYPSTDKAVQPPSVYGATKRIVERYCQSVADEATGLAIRLLRLVNVAGTAGSVVEVFTRQIAAGLPISVTDRRMDRYWMTMAEATQLLLATAGRERFGGIHLLDVGAPVPLIETVQRLATQLRPGAGEPEVRLVGIRPGERLHELLHYPDERRRPTELPGLDVLELPPATLSAADWRVAFGEVRERLLTATPALLRDWLFRAAGASQPAELRLGGDCVGEGAP
jgi:FlaA1/EpsC-like NDP-sugar epimerase